MEQRLTHVSLFSGIGGIDLAAEWAGFKTVLFVEIDPYCQKVLKKHWSDVPIIGDIRDVTKERIMAYALSITGQVRRDDKPNEGKGGIGRTHDRRSRADDCGFTRTSQNEINHTETELPPITLITGGFPCQPVSHAGKRRGKEDDRWLWPEMLRVISEIRPTWVVAENVSGLLNMGFNDCISNLESIGYETTSFLIPACGVNAPHRRDRIFIVAFSGGKRWNIGGSNRGRGYLLSDERLAEEGEQEREGRECGSGEISSDVADTIIRTEGSTHREGSDERRSDSEQDHRDSLGNDIGNGNCEGRRWWATEPELGRVAYGIPHRVDRLKCLGNAVVPQQIYPILKAIAEIESSEGIK